MEAEQVVVGKEMALCVMEARDAPGSLTLRDQVEATGRDPM